MNEKGQAMVEVAVIMPLLILLVCGTLVLGMAVQAKIVVVNAAKEGARLAAVGGTDTEVRNRVELVISTAGMRVTADRFVKNTDVVVNRTNSDIQVSVVYRQPTYAPAVVPGPITVRGVAVFRVGG